MADMTREQAARVLEWHIIEPTNNRRAYCVNIRAKDFDEYSTAYKTAIACLRSPGASPDVDGKAGGWVRTSERVPTEEDADDDGYVPCLLKGMFTGRTIRIALKYQVVTADTVMFFLPLPPLPEVGNE